LPITSSQMTHLWDGLCAAYRALGFEAVIKGDNVFRDLVLAGIIEPTSKIDATRVLSEVGVEPASYATLGLLTDASGFPLTVEAFAGNKAETATMLPVINAFKAAHRLTDVTVAADAGMISEANQVALQAAGCRSSSAPGSRLRLTWCDSGVPNTPRSRSLTGWC